MRHRYIILSAGFLHSNPYRLQQILISRFIINLQRCTNNTDGMTSTIGQEPTTRHASKPSSRRPGQTIHLISNLFEGMEGELSHGFKGKEEDDSFDTESD